MERLIVSSRPRRSRNSETDPSEFPHWLTFQRKVVPEDQEDPDAFVKDDFGEVVEDWTATPFTTWGAFEPAGGSEFWMSQKRHAESTARFRIPDRNDGLVQDYPAIYQIVHAGRTWDIHGAETMPAGIHVETWIEASEVR